MSISGHNSRNELWIEVGVEVNMSLWTISVGLHVFGKLCNHTPSNRSGPDLANG